MQLKVKVPTTLSEITLEQYQRFARLDGDTEFLTKKALEIFCGVPLEDLPNVRFGDVSNVTRHINTMMSEKPQLTPIFKLGEVDYGFIPMLEDISYGEFVDLDAYLQDTATLHKAMSVLYRPVVERVGKRYDIAPYKIDEDAAEAMKQAPMDVVMGATLFFYRLGSELLSNIVTSLEEAIPTTTPPNPNSENDGDGMGHSMRLLKEMSEDLKRYLNSPSINV